LADADNYVKILRLVKAWEKNEQFQVLHIRQDVSPNIIFIFRF